MIGLDDYLKEYLREQIALEEHLFNVIEHQISEIDEDAFADARNLLINTRETLNRHFVTLNEMLDDLEQETLSALAKSASTNGTGVLKALAHKSPANKRISRMLREDYSALNLITISNTLLHTTALALGCTPVATVALQHLSNLAPLVVRLGELLPEVVTRELHAESPKIDTAVAQTALMNTRQAWKQ